MNKSLYMPILLLTLFIPMQFQAKSDQRLSRNNQNLLRAINMKNLQLIKRTIDLGANINEGDGFDYPLNTAILENSLEIVQYLVQRGANINQKSSRTGTTPLMWAVMLGSLDIVKYLVNNGADINARENDGSTVLMWAASLSKKEIMDYLESLPNIDISAKDDEGRTAQDLLEELNKDREANALSENQ